MADFRASATGTAHYRDRFADTFDPGHFREFDGLFLSSIGLGTYLGNHDDETDVAYGEAIERAIQRGINVLDSAANYRFQRSERVLGQVLSNLIRAGRVARNEVVISTKGGYVPFDGEPPRSREAMMAYLDRTFFQPAICAPEDFVQGSHSMTPRYLDHQLTQSLRNLKLSAIDVYYIHNPESQFAAVDRTEFKVRLRAAFEFLESAVSDGRIARYGVATWSGFRVSPTSPEYLSLVETVELAREVAGDSHHFAVVQLPLNLLMREALTTANQSFDGSMVPLLEAANELGVMVVASASLLQSRLSTGLPPVVSASFGGMRTDAQRAIQFARSAPGVTTALIGMGRSEHVDENTEIALVPPAEMSHYIRLFGGLNE